MEKIIIQNTIEPKIKKALNGLESTFKIRMAVETKHGSEIRTTEITGILIGYNEENGDFKIRKTGNGLGEIVTISGYDVEDII